MTGTGKHIDRGMALSKKFHIQPPFLFAPYLNYSISVI